MKRVYLEGTLFIIDTDHNSYTYVTRPRDIKRGKNDNEDTQSCEHGSHLKEWEVSEEQSLTSLPQTS